MKFFGFNMPRREQPSRDVQRLAVTLNIAGMDELIVLFRTLVTKADTISQKLDAVMAQSKEMTDFIARLNTATNTLAQRVEALKDKITQGGMSESDEKAGIAEADAIVSSLENIGADPAEPLPEPTPPTP